MPFRTNNTEAEPSPALKAPAPVKVAIIGTGGIAKRHAERFSAIKNCRVVAACDINLERAEAFAAEHGIPGVYSDLDALLEKETFVALSNATPDALHAPLSIRAIEAGKHVLCEKPLALNYPDALSMQHAAEHFGVTGMIQFSYREAPAIEHARRLVSGGQLGEVVHVDGCYLQPWLAAADWRESPSLLWRLSTDSGSTGVLGDLGVHLLDLVSYPVGEISALSASLPVHRSICGQEIGGVRINANDTAAIQLEFAVGATGTLHTTRWAGGYGNTIQLRIYGTRGSLRLDLARSRNQLELCAGDNLRKQAWETIECPPVEDNFQKFIRSIQSNVALEPGFARGARIQAVLDATILSNAEGRKVTLEEILHPAVAA